METKKKAIIITAIIIGLIVGIFAIYNYVEYREYCQDHFQENTNINGVNCSNLTKEETISKLTQTWNENQFVVTAGDSTLLTIANLDFTYDIDKSVSEAMEKSAKFPLFNRLFGRNHKLKLPMTPAADNQSFEAQVSTLTIFDASDDVKTADAYLDMSNTEFNIIPEVQGTNIDRAAFEQKIYDLIADGKWSLEYDEKDFYVKPTVTSDSKDLKTQQEYAKKYLSNVITYSFGGTSRVITPAELNKMMTADDKGTITVNADEVTAFVKALADTYNTAGSSINFKSTWRGTVTVSGGTYGYRLDQDAEVAQLTEDIKAAKNVTREPIFSQKGWGWSNGGVGNTYVEIDIANQHVWYYENGNLIVSTDVVTGSVAGGTTTVRGAYYLVYKSANVTLKGKNADGTDYESPVSYWMPFYHGYGLHDASWRGSFGGSIYRSSGSHGCVNMPVSQAAKLYNNISSGCPVIVF